MYGKTGQKKKKKSDSARRVQGNVLEFDQQTCPTGIMEWQNLPVNYNLPLTTQEGKLENCLINLMWIWPT